MPRKKQIKTAQTFGTMSKAQIFEQLIEKVLGRKVRLEVAPDGLREENRIPENPNPDSGKRPAEAPGQEDRFGAGERRTNVL